MEGIAVGKAIKNDSVMMLKLTSAGLLMLAAKEKINSYIERNYEIYQEITEDEEALEYFNLYYEENEEELKKVAHESLVTAKEVEDAVEEWSNENGFKR